MIIKFYRFCMKNFSVILFSIIICILNDRIETNRLDWSQLFGYKYSKYFYSFTYGIKIIPITIQIIIMFSIENV